jgi:hypothetical protein
MSTANLTETGSGGGKTVDLFKQERSKMAKRLASGSATTKMDNSGTRVHNEYGKKVGEWKVYDKAGALKQRKVFKAKK